MNEKHDETKQFAPFNSLAEELSDNIRKKLQEDKPSHNMFAFTCRTFYRLAKVERLRVRLADCIVAGEQLEAQKMLVRFSHLLLCRGTIIDKSERIFENITIWEYILWALDVKFMGPMVVDCLPLNEEGKQIAENLLSQLQYWEQHEITYLLNGEYHNEQYYDFSILTALQTFVTQFSTWEWGEQTTFWSKDVRRAQLYAPAHIAQHYYAPEAFNAETLTRVLTLNQSWWSEQGIEETVATSGFALVKGSQGCNAVSHMRGTNIAAQRDFTELTILRHNRLTQDLPALKQKLVDFIHNVDRQYQASNAINAG